ncbi:hypothetical protein EIP91_008326 [Steccherinum ochraceum]|uniref:beta-glucosidase n=1 Tax=Steccherinum ochraceum TaxID=92696 RepID=A0A4R0RPX6_9APHY|nr:hypothetical protein EIP91_008326 [Steccherinum ochraceum]
MVNSTESFDVDKVLASLSLKDKVTLLAGKGWWFTEPIEGKVPSAKMSDGPNGVRGEQFFNGTPSSCFPSSTGLGSTFDVELAAEIGKALGNESRAKGVHVLLAPTVNTQRSPLGGRGFESFSEDPLLNGKIAASYINGLQSKGVAATIKHFVANDQEFERFSISSEVSERALREIYLKPFQIAIKESNPWALMTSYNRVNGLHASENPWLLQDILRKEWGYTGTLMSDWIGTYSTAEAIKAGLDIEMPGPSVVRGPALIRALQSEKLFPEDIDTRARKVLELVKHATESGIPFNQPEEVLDNAEVRKLLRLASASSVVLLKNNASLLPLQVSASNTPSIAIIGPNAKQAQVSGGGSAALRPTYTVSPLEGVRNVVKELGGDPGKVQYSMGSMTQKYLPLADPYITLPSDGKTSGGKFEFWNESPTQAFIAADNSALDGKLPEPAWSTTSSSAYAFLADGVDETKVNDVCWLRYTTTFVPDEDGTWEFALCIAGRGTLFVDGNLAIDLSTDAPLGDTFFGLGTIEKRESLALMAGQQYQIEIRTFNGEFMNRGAPFKTRGGLRFGAMKFTEKPLEEAKALAAKSDIVILVVGLNHDYESEGFDREHMRLPGNTDQLVNEILAANSKTIVVNQSGTPVEMPWINDAKTLLHAFYGGNDVGNGLADVIFGNVNPSAKLPLSWPKRLEDNPSWPSYGIRNEERGKVLYNEGIFVGYRGYEIKKVEPLFPFGYGLSYTTFKYADLKVPKETGDDSLTITFTVENTGKVDGKETAQVYVKDNDASLPRPVKELKAFTKVTLKAGEKQSVSVTLNVTDLGFWDSRKGTWVAEEGTFDVIVAPSSDLSAGGHLTGTVKLTKTVTYNGL